MNAPWELISEISAIKARPLVLNAADGRFLLKRFLPYLLPPLFLDRRTFNLDLIMPELPMASTNITPPG